ncbi:hypothetical protein [Cetobacterium somerae]|uniref:hypothetical protein n=1 Tax=Cetobacterium somerae TaxID=188913 RepID=UPI00248F4088|nr:hypothetical protein [Cetobacterium somerae]
MLVILIIISLLVPGLGIVIDLMYLYKNKNKNKNKIIYVMIAIAFGLLAYSINYQGIKTPGGDIYRFYKEAELLSKLQINEILAKPKVKLNFIYYMIVYTINFFNLYKNFLSFFLTFGSYVCILFSLDEVKRVYGKFESGNKNLVIIFTIMLYFSSPYMYFSVSKTIFCLAIFCLGVVKYSLRKKKTGIIFIILGIFSHNIGLLLAAIFFISMFKIKINKWSIVILLAFFNKIIIVMILKFLNQLNLIEGYSELLIEEYIYGPWSSIFNGNGIYGYIHVYRAFIILVLGIFFLKKWKWEKNLLYYFIQNYLVFCTIFFSYQIVMLRLLIWGSFYILILLFIIISKVPKMKLYLLIFLFLFDLFNAMEYGFKVGMGFPLVIFEPIFFLLQNYNLN